jgi:hypothetical protein
MSDLEEAILRHVFNAATMIFFSTDLPSDQAAIEKILSKKFKAENIGRLKRGETFVKMVNSVFNMATECVTNVSSAGYKKEIIAASRARYTDSEPDKDEVRNQNPREIQQKQQNKNFGLILSNEEKAFLECAFKNPDLSVTKIYKALKVSAYMGDKLKTALKARGLIQEIVTHLGTGSRIAKFIVLTPAGFDAIGVVFASEDGKGGPLHRYWQTVVKLQATSMGYRVSIEKTIPNSRETVDLVLVRDSKEIAVEVSSTTQAVQEISNVKKCLAAGYEKVVTLFMDEEKLQVFEGLLLNDIEEQERSRVSAGMINGFCQFLK